jgi:hypothetical protein
MAVVPAPSTSAGYRASRNLVRSGCVGLVAFTLVVICILVFHDEQRAALLARMSVLLDVSRVKRSGAFGGYLYLYSAIAGISVAVSCYVLTWAYYRVTSDGLPNAGTAPQEPGQEDPIAEFKRYGAIIFCVAALVAGMGVAQALISGNDVKLDGQTLGNYISFVFGTAVAFAGALVAIRIAQAANHAQKMANRHAVERAQYDTLKDFHAHADPIVASLQRLGAALGAAHGEATELFEHAGRCVGPVLRREVNAHFDEKARRLGNPDHETAVAGTRQQPAATDLDRIPVHDIPEFLADRGVLPTKALLYRRLRQFRCALDDIADILDDLAANPYARLAFIRTSEEYRKALPSWLATVHAAGKDAGSQGAGAREEVPDPAASLNGFWRTYLERQNEASARRAGEDGSGHAGEVFVRDTRPYYEIDDIASLARLFRQQGWKAQGLPEEPVDAKEREAWETEQFSILVQNYFFAAAALGNYLQKRQEEQESKGGSPDLLSPGWHENARSVYHLTGLAYFGAMVRDMPEDESEAHTEWKIGARNDGLLRLLDLSNIIPSHETLGEVLREKLFHWKAVDESLIAEEIGRLPYRHHQAFRGRPKADRGTEPGMDAFPKLLDAACRMLFADVCQRTGSRDFLQYHPRIDPASAEQVLTHIAFGASEAVVLPSDL